MNTKDVVCSPYGYGIILDDNDGLFRVIYPDRRELRYRSQDLMVASELEISKLLQVGEFKRLYDSVNDIDEGMAYEPVKKVRYGVEVWVNPLMELARRRECLCLNCGTETCEVADKLYELCKEYNLAMAITRCPKWSK
jgi:hypothetical protein